MLKQNLKLYIKKGKVSLSAYIQFGNNEIGKYSKEYMLKDVKCHFIREHDAIRPVADAYCESIEISVFVPGKMI